MRVPLSWLKEFVDITLPVPDLAERLTFAGLEVEDTEYIGVPAPASKTKEAGLAWDRDKIFVGQLVEVKQHPNADRLTLAVVDYGRGEPIQVVTGAPNIRAGDKGQKVVLALEGSRLYDGHKDGRVLMTLKKSKIRGVESGSMVCSEKELGISEEHEGIILLPDDAPVGTPLVDYLGDVVFDIKINPNMARAASVLGVAREIAALTGEKLKVDMAQWNKPTTGAETDFVKIEIADASLCRRYTAMLVRGVEIKPSPFWVQRRLELVGQRSINNIVDVSNYVMFAIGKPVHAFDYDALVARANGARPTIIVRAAKNGESLQTLDGLKRMLKDTDILIKDSAGAIALGGIMGGAETEVSATTRNVLIESAAFDYISIRRTTAEQKLPSEAATRFGRGIPPSQTIAGAVLSAEMMQLLAGGSIASGIADNYPSIVVLPEIEVTTHEVKRQLGIEMSVSQITKILTALDFQVEPRGTDTLVVTPPEYREDVDGAHDVIEELVRIHGYDKIPSVLIDDALPPLVRNLGLEREENARDLLSRLDLQEVVTYVFTSPAHEALLIPAHSPNGDGAGRMNGVFDPLPNRPYVAIENPNSPERSVLRQTLLPNMLDILAANLRFANRASLFEIGNVFLSRTGDDPANPDALPEDRTLSLPLEPLRLGILMTGPDKEAAWNQSESGPNDFYDLKGVIEDLAADLHLKDVRFAPITHPTFHPGRAAEIRLGMVSVGIFGELHPYVREQWQLPAQAVLAGEFDLAKIFSQVDERFIVIPISRYPAVVQDIALLVNETIPEAQVEWLIRQTGGALLTRAELFDLYRGDPLPPHKKSLAFRLTFQALDRVLSDTDAAKLREKIVQRTAREFGAELRSG